MGRPAPTIKDPTRRDRVYPPGTRVLVVNPPAGNRSPRYRQEGTVREVTEGPDKRGNHVALHVVDFETSISIETGRGTLDLGRVPGFYLGAELAPARAAARPDAARETNKAATR